MVETPDPEPVTLAQVGCGYWGPNLLRCFAAQDGCEVRWVADLRPERREYAARNLPGCRVTERWQEAVEDPAVAAVVIATPPAQHYEMAHAALSAGKHVLVEKPLALAVRDAEQLAGLAAERSRVLMVGHTFLYNAAVRYVRDLVARDEIGSLLYLYSQRLNLGQVRSDVNAWWNLAPHDISILLYLMDGQRPVSVAVRGAAFLQSGVEDVAFAVLTWPSGVHAHIHVSWLDPGKVRRMTLVGSRKMLVYDDLDERKVAICDMGVDRVPRLGERMDFDDLDTWRLLHRAGDVLLPRLETAEPLRVEAAHFLDCVRSGAAPLTGARHAIDVVAVLEAGQESLGAGGGAVSLEA